ncbi:MAG: hypothetical protein L3K19_00820 [Thermoplasmata archaeon]|nr:hypothetical protein [Thermoplasmata archaeon]
MRRHPAGVLRGRLPVHGFRPGLAAVLALLVFPTLPLAAGSAAPGLAVIGPDRQYPSTCPFNATDIGSARDVLLPSPSFALSRGDALSVSYEFAIHNVTHRTANLLLTVPSFTAKFPLANGSSFDSFLAPRTVRLNGTAWSSGSIATHTSSISGAVRFAAAPARMTSELLAIMANASYQTATIVFRWDWSVTFGGNGTTVTSPWSHVSTTGPHPSSFYPAPYVRLVSNSNNSPAIGSQFTAYLTGATSGTIFHSVLEYASTGRAFRNDETTTGPGNSTPDAVSVWILPYRAPLAPATLLDHVRDYCLSLLYSISLHAVYAPWANVTLTASPSRCGPVRFNGTAYASGSVLRVRPSVNGIPIGVSACSGKAFQGWTRSAGVWVGRSGSMTSNATISAWGNLTARFA